MRDLVLAIRSLLKSKLFTAVAVITLAIGIGSTTAVFSLFSAVAVRPLPFTDQSRLVDVEEWSATELCDGCSVGVSRLTLQDMAAQTKSLQSTAAYVEVPTNVSGADVPERVSGALVSGNFFPMLGVNAAIGRALDPTDDRPDAPPVVVISSRLFAHRFANDTSVVGRQIRINGTPHTVVGVMSSKAILPEFAELWTPMGPTYRTTDRTARELGVIGRLRDGYSVGAAETELRTIAAGIATAHPETQRGWTMRVRSLRVVLGGDETFFAAVLLGAVLVLLLIVCANLAGLMLARGAARRKDIAVRLALGARRSSIIWHLLAESLCLAIAGGVLGVVAASWAVDVMLVGLGTRIPSWLVPEMDYRVLGFSLAMSVGAAIAFGLVPALRSSRADVHEDIKAGGQSSLEGRRATLRGSLVVVQMALSLVLLTAAGVLAVSTHRISARETGVSDHDVLQAQIDMLGNRTADQYVATTTTMLDRLSQIGGVRTAAVAATGFIRGFGSQPQSIRAEGVTEVQDGVSPRFYFAVTPAYFETLRLRRVDGRFFTERDRQSTEPVVIINEAMARQLWPTGSAIGRRIKLGAADSLQWKTVIGLVSNIGNPAAGRVENFAYVPFAQAPQTAVRLLVGTRGDPASLIPAIRETARSVEPDVPLVDLMTVEEDHARQYSPYRASALMMSAVGIIALVLAGIGLYGVVAFSAEQRTREVGLRIALGATRVDVFRLVGREGARLVGIGVVFGIGGALVVLPVMRSMLFGATPLNPLVIAAAALILVVVAFIASFIPAHRASRVDPMIALRSE